MARKSGKKRRTGDNTGKNRFDKVPCVIGIDQSYSNTGLAIIVNGRIKKLSKINFKGCKTKTDKRDRMETTLLKVIQSCRKHFEQNEIVIFVERIRTFTSGDELRPGVIKPHAALIAKVVDTAYHCGIKVYSVDTRCWKNAVLGTAKPAGFPYPGCDNPKKIREVKYICELGFAKEMEIYSQKKNEIRYDDDMADAACIGLYGFTPGPLKLLLET